LDLYNLVEKIKDKKTEDSFCYCGKEGIFNKRNGFFPNASNRQYCEGCWEEFCNKEKDFFNNKRNLKIHISAKRKTSRK